MRAHTNALPTEEVSLTFIGPVAMMQQALEAMHSLGFKDSPEASDAAGTDAVPWRESAHFQDVHSGSVLSGARYRENMTQAVLSERSGIPRRHISEMENGRRPIGKANARKLAAALHIDPRLLLSVNSA
jgi:plasmid maintenance system antidote protein VapI